MQSRADLPRPTNRAWRCAGTELAFERDAQREPLLPFLPTRKIGHKVARFRQIKPGKPTHHDALEFPGGQVVLVTQLCEGQRATVLQLPVSGPSLPHEPQATPLRAGELINQGPR